MKWLESKIHKMKWYDMSLVKLSVFSFALLVAKLWSPILGFEWYWYGIVFLVAMVRPMQVMFGK
ncbi:MAG: hypothetical protein ABIJ34_05875 [archaeon]